MFMIFSVLEKIKKVTKILVCSFSCWVILSLLYCRFIILKSQNVLFLSSEISKVNVNQIYVCKDVSSCGEVSDKFGISGKNVRGHKRGGTANLNDLRDIF